MKSLGLSTRYTSPSNQLTAYKLPPSNLVINFSLAGISYFLLRNSCQNLNRRPEHPSQNEQVEREVVEEFQHVAVEVVDEVPLEVEVVFLQADVAVEGVEDSQEGAVEGSAQEGEVEASQGGVGSEVDVGRSNLPFGIGTWR